MKSICIFVFIIGSTLSTAAFDEDSNYIRQIYTKKAGKEIIQTILLEVGQSKPVESIYNLLLDLQAQYLDQKQSTNTLMNERQQRCSKSLSEVIDAIRSTKETIADLEGQVPARQELLEGKQYLLDNRQRDLDTVGERAQQFLQQRKAEHDAFMERRDEMTRVINGLKEAKTIVSQLKVGQSFLEIQGTILTELQSHNKKLLFDTSYKHGMKGLLQVLVQVMSDQTVHSDQETVKVVIELIDDLCESLYQLQNQEMFADDIKQRLLDSDLARFNSEEIRLKSLIVSDDAQVQFISLRLQDLQSSIQNYKLSLESKISEQAQWKATCDEEQREYQRQLNNATEALSIIQSLILTFETNPQRFQALLQNIKQYY